MRVRVSIERLQGIVRLGLLLEGAEILLLLRIWVSDQRVQIRTLKSRASLIANCCSVLEPLRQLGTGGDKRRLLFSAGLLHLVALVEDTGGLRGLDCSIGARLGALAWNEFVGVDQGQRRLLSEAAQGSILSVLLNLAYGEVFAPFPTCDALLGLHLAGKGVVRLHLVLSSSLVRQLNVCLVDNHLWLTALL